MRASTLLLLAALGAAACRPATEAPSADTDATATSSAATAPELPASTYDPTEQTYAGSQRCQPCHFEVHATWAKSSHATTVRPADMSDEEQVESFIECSDIYFSHVLGDRHHVRYLVEDEDNPWGEGRWLALPCGWDLHEKEVTIHHPDAWRTLPWENGCAGCHVTGFQAEDRSFLEFGVGCEECHGPAEAHANSGDKSLVYSFAGRSAADEVRVCASCHLQGGFSRSTGLKKPPHYLVGGLLMDDYEFDWSQLETGPDAKILDVHQKLTVKAVLVDGDEGLTCTSCHSLHDLKHEKHQRLPRQDYCLLCHQDDFSLKEYSQSCNVCEF